ncbi:unnamed protein product [Diamesa tonsa]
MVSKEGLKEQFDELGVDPSEEVLDKCLEICVNCGQDDPVEFVEQWMAYSISHLGGAEPTVQYLIEMENKEFIKLPKSGFTTKATSNAPSANLRVYNEDSDDEQNDLLGAYVCITPKADKRAISKFQNHTPDVSKTAFSPVSYSPLTTSKRPKLESVKSGNAVYTFGSYSAASQTTSGNKNVEIKLAELNDGTKYIGERTKYMTTSAIEDGLLVGARVYDIGKEISLKILADQKKKGIKMEDGESLTLSHCDNQSQETVRCLGKIFCGGRQDTLDDKTCIFVGFDENKSRIVQLDFSRLKPSVAVFPGEICIISGNNPRGKIFYVHEIYSERILENCPPPMKEQVTEPINLVIASAPFTSEDNLLFEYLDKLMLNCQNNKPDVLILTGAFLPQKSNTIFDVALELDNHFKKMLSGISERMGDTKTIIVSSLNDINSSAVYPTHPYKLKIVRPYHNLFFVPDPCVVDINGVQIALTSTDITQHLADSEYCVNAGGDKIRRFVNYLFHQKSFYPLYPPKISTDLKLLHEYGTINKIPNILVVPSDLKYYMRDINNCLCINPGRLEDQNKEGTIARVTIQAPKDASKGLSSFLSGQIVHI